MAYVAGFKYDLFISYSHIDNEPVEEGKGWIDEFESRLKQALWARIGTREVNIWRDPLIDGNVVFDERIRAALKESAALIAITSPGYLKSEYCRQELAWFAQNATTAKFRLSVGDRLRIFNVRRFSIPDHKLPPEFAGTSGYPINDSQVDDDEGNPLIFSSDKFQSVFNKLVKGIFTLLSEMNPPASPPAIPAAKEAIYMADVADSLADLKERVTNELQKDGIRVLRSIPPPHEASAHDRETIDEMKSAALSVHLLDSFLGRRMEGRPEKSYPQAQLELGRQFAKCQFIWVPKDLEIPKIENEVQKRLLSKLAEGSAQAVPYTFVRSLSTSIARNIRAELDAQEKQSQQISPKRAALIDTHLKDQDHAQELGSYLKEHGIEPYINPVEEDPRINMQIFAQRLKQVSILIILYGQVTEEWVRRRLGLAVQTAIEEGCELKACGIYLAPPRKNELRLRIPERFLKISLLENSERFNPETVNELLNTAYASVNAS